MYNKFDFDRVGDNNMSKYIKYSLMFVFALCSLFLIRQQSVQAVSSDDITALTFYDLNNSTKDNVTYYSFTNTYLKGLLDEAYNTDGFDISGYNYFIVIQRTTNVFDFLFFNNYVNFNIGKISSSYILGFDKNYSYSSFRISISNNSANMSNLIVSTTANGYRNIDYGYIGISTNMNFKSFFDTNISATQYTSPTLTWSGNYNTNYSMYSLYAQINTPNRIKYYVTSPGSDQPVETKDFPVGGKLQVTNDCKIYLYGVNESGNRVTVNYECDVTQIGNPSEAGQLLGFNLQLRKDGSTAYINPVLPQNETYYYSCFVKVQDGADVIDGGTLTSDFTATNFNSEIAVKSKSGVADSYTLLFEVKDKNGLVMLDQTLTVLVDKTTGDVSGGGTTTDDKISDFGLNEHSSIKDVYNAIKNSAATFMQFFSIVPGFIWAMVVIGLGLAILLLLLGR